MEDTFQTHCVRRLHGSLIFSLRKIDFIIEKPKGWHLCITANVYQTRLLFYATQIINPFPNSMISANHVKWEEFQPIVKNLFSLGTFVIILRRGVEGTQDFLQISANQCACKKYYIVFRKITFETFYHGKMLSWQVFVRILKRIYILASDLVRKKNN